MAKTYFKVFQQPGDHVKWSKQIEFASVMDTEESLRKDFVSALEFLQEELGKGFLKTTSINHPIYQKISNKAEWQIHELIQFADTLKKIKKSNSNYPKLKSKLLSLQDSKTEGIPFSEITGPYLKENFTVKFLNENNIRRTPDIEIINPTNNDKFFIEVSVLQDSQERRHQWNSYDFLYHNFHHAQPFYVFTGKQKTEISKADYPEIQKIIADAKNQVTDQEKTVTYSDSRFEFTILSPSHFEELDTICEENGTRKNEIIGMPVNFDETARLINNDKIKYKASQIPLDGNGIIYFRIGPMFFMVSDIANSVIRLQNYIASFPNLLGIVLYSTVLHPQGEAYMKVKKNVFSSKMIGNVLCRELLFVYNQNCNLLIQKETLKKIYCTFK